MQLRVQSVSCVTKSEELLVCVCARDSEKALVRQNYIPEIAGRIRGGAGERGSTTTCSETLFKNQEMHEPKAGLTQYTYSAALRLSCFPNRQ